VLRCVPQVIGEEFLRLSFFDVIHGPAVDLTDLCTLF
jgi:hypothetical protein